MPTFNVTLSTEEWESYQSSFPPLEDGSSSAPIVTEATAWLKRQLLEDFDKRLAHQDSANLESDSEAKLVARKAKVDAWAI
jgi:hypothetical protein